MKRDDLLDALNEIDPQYIIEAEETKKSKVPVRKLGRYLAMAACACLILSGAFLVTMGRNTSKSSKEKAMPNVPESNAMEEKEKATQKGSSKKDEATNEIPQKIYVNKAVYEQSSSTESYQKKNLTCIGELGKSTTSIYAENGITGYKVYQVDENRIMVEIKGTCYTYSKE